MRPHQRPSSLLLVIVITVAAAAVAAQETKYKAPRTESGHPDLQGVWNFDSGVPLERPPAFAGKTFFTKEEFEQQRAPVKNGLAAIARFAPVEAIGLDWIDHSLQVDDLRTSLITYPENGRLPAVVEGVRRMPRFDELIAALGGANSGQPPATLIAFATMFGGGRKDSYTDFTLVERCDELMVLRLRGDFGGAGELTLSQRVAGAEVIRATGQVAATSPGEISYTVPAAWVRQLPVTEVELLLTAQEGNTERPVGSYTLVHGGSLHR